MRIGTFAQTNQDVIDAVKQGADFVDLRMELIKQLNIAEAKQVLGDAGIPCTLHLPTEPDWKPIDVSRGIVPYIDLGRELDAEIVTIHTTLSSLFYSDEDIDTFLGSIHLACQAAKDAGVVLSVETLGSYFTELALLFDAQPETMMTLDIGHGQILASRNRALGLIESFFDKIAMVNIHDNHGREMTQEVLEARRMRQVSIEEMRELARRYDTHLSIGEGTVDFEPVFRSLKERSYDGRFLMLGHDRRQFPLESERFMKAWLSA